MHGSLEVRKYLWEQDDTVAKGSGVPLPRNGEPSRISAEQVHRARMAVARGALGAEDCRMLLDMLGLVPSEEDGIPPVRR
ncbi:hypothetical protein N8J89_39580 [Crossiella sp. CA-258035]|uniref:hypothetical protein n=1 Tax=Crossiella sp. CA-258035 TaxID=2981138 RepID=UPI0024BBFE5A|nr:hypothetical protein [Crossiella sp. CA-258035]WHT19125.1 hypothetical protein N8J89_39580 [Crossiella sp. CA-258035]